VSRIIFAFPGVNFPHCRVDFLHPWGLHFPLDIQSMQTYDAAMNSRKKVRTTVTLTAGQSAKLKRIARNKGLPLSWQVRTAVDFWLANRASEVSEESSLVEATMLAAQQRAPAPAE